MTMIVQRVLLGVALLAGVTSCAAGPARTNSQPPRAGSAVRDADIAFYEARVVRDPYGALDRAALGALYLGRGKATGSETDYRRAERLARESFRTRRRRNDHAASVLTGALMAQHRFVEARNVLQEVMREDPTDPTVRATLGEIDLELGRYPEADRLFGSVALLRTTGSIGTRYARWLEINGHSGEARELLAGLRDEMAGGFRIQPDQLAWFDLRLGDLAFRNGRLDLAAQTYRRGLATVPEDPRLLTALAQLRAAEGHWQEAIALGERSIAGLLDPATLGLLADSYEAIGDSGRSGEYARAMEVAVSRQPGAYHRGWALFLLDRHRRVDDMLARSMAELATRKDVYGYDVAAWALHQAGRDREARVLSDSALARGTRDGLLHFHAGVIALGLADSSHARSEFTRALDINAHFHPRHADEARLALRGLSIEHRPRDRQCLSC
jgi:tetratricopeptide (TPR) repeat protein